MELKAGARLRSVTCETEVVVVKAARAGDLACGGAPMVALGDEAAAAAPLDPAFAGGSALGKRYTDEEGTIEILCVKAGAGSISVDGQLMGLKVAKALPASD